MSDTKLKRSEVEDRVKTLTTALGEKRAEADAILTASKGSGTDGDPIVVSDEQKAAFQQVVTDMREIREELGGLKGYLDASDLLDATPKGIAGAANAGQGMPREEAKSIGERFLGSEEFKALGNGAHGTTMQKAWDTGVADLGGLWTPGRKDVYSSMPGGTPGALGTVQRDPMVDRARRNVRVRDLFGVQTTTAAVIEYFRVTGFTNNASVVPERDGGAFGTKPQSSLSIEGAQAPVRTIAHWEAAHRNVLADEPQLRGIIDNELLYGLRLTEDDQVLNGTGTGEDLLGILNTPGVQSYAQSSGPATDNKADAIRRAATLAFLAYYEPTGIVVHPNDWEDMELTKDTNGQYLLAVSIALGAEARLWRMPVVDTPAIAEGTALVGAFGLGSQLYDREQSTIRIAEQHADFFIRNAIVVLAEQRLALATKRPESFVEVTFS